MCTCGDELQLQVQVHAEDPAHSDHAAAALRVARGTELLPYELRSVGVRLECGELHAWARDTSQQLGNILHMPWNRTALPLRPIKCWRSKTSDALLQCSPSIGDCARGLEA